MKLLLDTHVLLWALAIPDRLSAETAGELVSPANDVFISAVTAWEIAIKQSLGKLDLPAPAETWLPDAVEQSGFCWLAIQPEDALRVGGLSWHHRDPFDRLLVAQALAGYTLVTRDDTLAEYGVETMKA